MSTSPTRRPVRRPQPVTPTTGDYLFAGLVLITAILAAIMVVRAGVWLIGDVIPFLILDSMGVLPEGAVPFGGP